MTLRLKSVKNLNVLWRFELPCLSLSNCTREFNHCVCRWCFCRGSQTATALTLWAHLRMAFSHSVQQRIQKERPLPPPLTKHTRACPREQLRRHLRENFNVVVSLVVFTYYTCAWPTFLRFWESGAISASTAAAKVSSRLLTTQARHSRLHAQSFNYESRVLLMMVRPESFISLDSYIYTGGRRVRNWLLPLEQRQWHIVARCFLKSEPIASDGDTNHPGGCWLVPHCFFGAKREEFSAVNLSNLNFYRSNAWSIR
jgi:hypothetical protein